MAYTCCAAVHVHRSMTLRMAYTLTAASSMFTDRGPSACLTPAANTSMLTFLSWGFRRVLFLVVKLLWGSPPALAILQCLRGIFSALCFANTTAGCVTTRMRCVWNKTLRVLSASRPGNYLAQVHRLILCFCVWFRWVYALALTLSAGPVIVTAQ